MLVVMPKLLGNNYENNRLSTKFAPNFDNPKVCSICLKTSESKKA